MAKIGYLGSLLRDVFLFARQNKVYWIVPFVLVLGAARPAGGDQPGDGALHLHAVLVGAGRRGGSRAGPACRIAERGSERESCAF